MANYTPTQELGDLWDTFSGKDSAEAAKEAARIQAEAAEKAMAEQRAIYEDVKGIQQPYSDMNLGGWQGYQDLVLGRKYEDDPVFSQLSADRMETLNRQGFSTGKGGGARLKRLMQLDAQNQMAQRQMRGNEFMTLGQAFSPAANTMSNARTGTGTNISNLLTSQGAAQAGGVMGAANARAAGVNNLMQLGGMAAGAFTGVPLPLPQAQMQSTTPTSQMLAPNYLPQKPDIFAQQTPYFGGLS